MKPLQPESAERVKWEEAVYDAIETDYEVSRSDAQAIVEAESDALESAWREELSPEDAAILIMEGEQDTPSEGVQRG